MLKDLDNAVNQADGIYDNIDSFVRYYCEKNKINPDEYEWIISFNRKDLIKDKLIELGFKEITTGGNCEAMQKTTEDGIEILVCASEHSVNFIDCEEICIGLYDKDGEFEKEYVVNSLDRLLHSIGESNPI